MKDIYIFKRNQKQFLLITLYIHRYCLLCQIILFCKNTPQSEVQMYNVKMQYKLSLLFFSSFIYKFLKKSIIIIQRPIIIQNQI